MQSSSEKPLVCITCGPAYEPVDDVRRLTNFSTGEIGTILSLAFTQQGFDVICFRGEGSTYPPPEGIDVRPFSTNASLAEGLKKLERAPSVFLHAAALCDFSVEMEGASQIKKLSSRNGPIKITLHPAKKLLPHLRERFPKALIVGWKYELEGTREDTIARGKEQIQETHIDACVINGAAFGKGFGFLLPSDAVKVVADKSTLANVLASWVETRL